MKRLLLLLLLLPATVLAEDRPEPFAAALGSAEVAVAPGGQAELVVAYTVAAQHFLYRDMSSVVVEGLPPQLTAGEASFPAGKKKHDEISDMEREIFEHGFSVTVPVRAAADVAPGKYPVTVRVKWQGCNKPENYCLFPATRELPATVVVSKAQSAWSLVPRALAGGKSWQPPGADLEPPAVDFSTLPESADVQPMDGDDEEHPVRARLLTDSTVVVPGQHFRLGVHLSPRTNWHTYWRSPGEIGLPTAIEWDLPASSGVTPYVYPRPERFDDHGIVSYGYDRPVLLYTTVALPKETPPGEVTLGATASWLVCEVMCIRGEAELSTTVTVGAAPESSTFAPLFDHFAALHPDPKGLRVESSITPQLVESEGEVKVRIVVQSDQGPIQIEQPDGVGTWPTFVPMVAEVFNGMLVDSSIKLQGGSLEINLEAMAYEIDAASPPPSDVIGGLVQVPYGDGWASIEVALPVQWKVADDDLAALDGAAGSPQVPEGAETVAEEVPPKGLMGLLLALLMAFFGGNILNVMPCVLPVLTMKLYSLIQQGDISDRDRRVAGYAYSAGIVASFLALGGVMVVLKFAFGESIGWGMQFQSPTYVAILATIVFVFGLSLFGVFEVPALGANQAAQASAKDGVAGYFLTGVFATLLATPCSAPFLGSAMGFALSLNAGGILLFFGVAGLGLAFPFLVIALVPALFRFLPRPGAWMDHFKQLMGFSLVATTVWLCFVLGKQVGLGTLSTGLTGFLFFLTVVSLGAWFFGRFGGPMESGRRQLGAFAVALVLAVVGGIGLLDLAFAEPEGDGSLAQAGLFAQEWDEIPWQPFNESNVAALRGQAMFIDFTADWCLTCKVNERTILSQNKVRQGMRDLKVVPLKADWTRKDETISKWLKDYGKAGVPFYLVMPSDPAAKPIPLPEVITPDLVLSALRQATGGA